MERQKIFSTFYYLYGIKRWHKYPISYVNHFSKLQSSVCFLHPKKGFAIFQIKAFSFPFDYHKERKMSQDIVLVTASNISSGPKSVQLFCPLRRTWWAIKSFNAISKKANISTNKLNQNPFVPSNSKVLQRLTNYFIATPVFISISSKKLDTFYWAPISQCFHLRWWCASHL